MVMQEPKRERIRADQLKIDDHIQRELDQPRAERMSKVFNRAAVGTLTVSRRGPGQNYILDGQTRWTANNLAGHGQAFLNCDVFVGLTLQEEAQIYEQRNDTKRLTPLDLFKARIVREDPIALGMRDMATGYGFQISRSSVNSLAGVASFERLYRASTKAAAHTLHVLTKAWHPRRETVAAKILDGVGAIYLRYTDDVDNETMVERLQAEFGGPLDLAGRSKAWGVTMGVSPGDAVASLVVIGYNRHKKRKINKLPSWEV